jgi:hypothetical protein
MKLRNLLSFGVKIHSKTGVSYSREHEYLRSLYSRLRGIVLISGLSVNQIALC